MAYIGKQPTAVPLTSSDITDGIVSNAKLAQDVISAETALTSAPADTDEFLLSDAGTLKRIDYSLIKGGGCWEKLITTSISSGDASVDFTNTYLTTTHLDYMIIGSGLKLASDVQVPRYYVSTDGGSTFVSTGYENARRGFRSNDTFASSAQNSGSSGLFFTPDGVGNASGEIVNFTSIIYDPLKQSGTTSAHTLIFTNGVYENENGHLTTFFSGNDYPSTTAVNGIRLLSQSGNLTSGSITLYGRKV